MGSVRLSATKMTKLLEFLTLVASISSLWLAVYLEAVDTCCYRSSILLSPLLLVITFGLYSVCVIAYRVATFNDCEEAALELQKQISGQGGSQKQRLCLRGVDGHCV